MKATGGRELERQRLPQRERRSPQLGTDEKGRNGICSVNAML